jgi:hypothetical protein
MMGDVVMDGGGDDVVVVSAESLGFGRTSVENERMTYIRGRALDSGRDDARTSYLHVEGSYRRSPRM